MCVHVFHIRFDTGPLIVIDLIEQILDNETLITPTNLNLKAVAFEIPKFHKAVVVSIGTLILKMPPLYNFQITMSLNLVIQAISDLEMNIVAVERVEEYTTLASEVIIVTWTLALLRA